MNSITLTIENARVSYGTHVALSIPELVLQGNTIAVLGHNGAGKSTLLKASLGLLPLSAGTLKLTQQSDAQVTRLIPEKHMAFCPETGAVFEDIKVQDYLRLWCRIKLQDPKYYEKAGQHYIDILEIAPLMKKLGRELSKGQRRRVQTAIGFLTNPRLFLFDEPFDGLDVQKTQELTELIEDHKEGMSFVISSHRMDVVERIADCAIVLHDGKIVAQGAVEDVSKKLGGSTYLISGIQEERSVTDSLKSHFSMNAISRIGDMIQITGHAVDEHGLHEFVKNSAIAAASVRKITPSLTDAMAYHLKSYK